MNIQKRVQFVFLHFKKIGILATFSYLLQRIIKSKNHLIVLKLKGLPHNVFLRNKKIKYFLWEIHESIQPGLAKQIPDPIPFSSTTSKIGEYTVIKNKLPDLL